LSRDHSCSRPAGPRRLEAGERWLSSLSV